MWVDFNKTRDNTATWKSLKQYELSPTSFSINTKRWKISVSVCLLWLLAYLTTSGWYFIILTIMTYMVILAIQTIVYSFKGWTDSVFPYICTKIILSSITTLLSCTTKFHCYYHFNLRLHHVVLVIHLRNYLKSINQSAIKLL